MRQDPRLLGRPLDGHLFVARMRLADDVQAVFAHDEVAVLAATLQHAFQLEAGRLLELRRRRAAAAQRGDRRRCVTGDGRNDALRMIGQGLAHERTIGEQMIGSLPDGCQCWRVCDRRSAAGYCLAEFLQNW